MAAQKASPLLNKEYAFLGVQHDFHKVSGTDHEKQVHSDKLEEIDSLAVEAKSYLEGLENNHIAEPSFKSTKLPFISLLLDHGSTETSDSDMLSVIEEVDEDSDSSEDNSLTQKRAVEHLNVRAEGAENLESDSTKARKKKTKTKAEEDTKFKEETENYDEVHVKGKLYKKNSEKKEHTRRHEKDSKAITDSKKVYIHNHEKFKKIHDHFSALERHEADILDLEVFDSKEDTDSDKETQKANTCEGNDESNTLKMTDKDNYKNVDGTEIQLKDNLYLLSIKTAGTHFDNLLEDENSPSKEKGCEQIINSTVNESYITGSINESNASCQSINELKTSLQAFPDSSPISGSTKHHDISNNNNILYASKDLNKCLTNVEFTDNSETVNPTVLRESSEQNEVNDDNLAETSDGFTDGSCHSISDGSFKLIDNVIEDAKTCHSIHEQAQDYSDNVFEDEPSTTVPSIQIGNVENANDRESKEQRLNSDELRSEIKAMQLSQKQAVFKSAVELHLDKGGRVTPPASVSTENEFFKAPVRPPRTKTKGTPTPSSSIPSSPEHSTAIHEGCLDSPRSEMLAGSRDSPQTVSECSVSHDDSGNVSGGSRGTTPEHRRTDSSYSQSSIPSTLSTDEEDIDRAVARVQKQTAGNRGNLLSVFGDSRESLASYYSDAGDIAYSNIPVTGEILFSLNYNYKTSMLEVGVKQCRDIAVADSRRRRSDPYVKTYLLPDRTRGGKRKTKVKKHTLSPTFDETLKYSITKSELENRTLWITVWHNDRFGRNVFLGEVTINFDYYKFEDPFPRWYPLQERMDAPPASMMVYKGDMSLCIRFVPADKLSASPSVTPGKHKKETGGKGQLQVKVKEARNLTAVKSNGFSDPFCKGYLLPERHKSSKQKTAVIKKDCNPTWNHTFIFEDVTLAELRERCLELTIWDYEKLSSNDFLGGVRLNLGTGLSQGKPVEWMDARGEEMSMWQAMLDRPNIWIDGALILRPNMEKRKY